MTRHSVAPLQAHLRYIMRIGSATSRFPLTDSELPATSCGKLFPKFMPRAETTVYNDDGTWELSFVLAGAISDLCTSVVAVNDHLSYTMMFLPLTKLLEGRSMRQSELRTKLLEICCEVDKNGQEQAKKFAIKGLTDVNKFVFKKLHASSEHKIANGNTQAMNTFIADLNSMYHGQKERYGVIGTGMEPAARRCMESMLSANDIFERATRRETVMMQARITRKDWRLEWVPDPNAPTKSRKLEVGIIRETLTTAYEMLDEARCDADKDAAISKVAEMLTTRKKSHALVRSMPSLVTKIALNDFKFLAKMHHGGTSLCVCVCVCVCVYSKTVCFSRAESFYETQPLPGCLHLLMRSVVQPPPPHPRACPRALRAPRTPAPASCQGAASERVICIITLAHTPCAACRRRSSTSMGFLN